MHVVYAVTSAKFVKLKAIRGRCQ